MLTFKIHKTSFYTRMGAQSSKVVPNTTMSLQNKQNSQVQPLQVQLQATPKIVQQPTTNTASFTTYNLPFSFNFTINTNLVNSNTNGNVPESVVQLYDEMFAAMYNEEEWEPYISEAMKRATGSENVEEITIDFDVIDSNDETHKGHGTGLVTWKGKYAPLGKVQKNVHSIIKEKMAAFGLFGEDEDGNEVWHVYVQPKEMYEIKQTGRNISALQQTLAARGTFEGRNKTRKNLPQAFESIAAQSIAPFLTGPGYKGSLPEQMGALKSQLQGGKRGRRQRRQSRKKGRTNRK